VGVTSRHPTALVADWGDCRTTISTNCDANYNHNKGCSTQVRHPGSYGRDFNSGGGGFYALARSKEYGIKVWFWPRRESSVPVDVRHNLEAVDPDLWGPPTAHFPTGDDCSYEEYFDAHMFIFDLTFCVRSFPAVLCGEMTHFVLPRAIGPVLVRFGPKAAVLPCPVTIVSYVCVAAPGGMLMRMLYQSSIRTQRHSQTLTGRSTPSGSTPLWSIDWGQSVVDRYELHV